MTHHCSECLHLCITRDASLYCTAIDAVISVDPDCDCDRFQSRYSVLGTPKPEDIRDRMTAFCAAHPNCSNCPYWHLHNHDLCVISFTTDSISY